SEDGTALTDAQAHKRSADEVLASENTSDRQVAVDPRTDPQTQDSVAVAMEAGSEVTLPLPQEDKASFLLTDDNPQQLIIQPIPASPWQPLTSMPGSDALKPSALHTFPNSVTCPT
ncbi:MAG TPA: hypothetical protein VJ993_06245, partial [Woeseiaceae bacterium]|nr:hypothetical protein [Woeseiaceae bacterium]